MTKEGKMQSPMAFFSIGLDGASSVVKLLFNTKKDDFRAIFTNKE